MKIAYLVYNFKDQDGFTRTGRLSSIFMGNTTGVAIHNILEAFNENYSDIASIEYLGVEDIENNILNVI